MARARTALVGLLAASCALALCSRAGAVKWRMFSAISKTECVSEYVMEDQWADVEKSVRDRFTRTKLAQRTQRPKRGAEGEKETLPPPPTELLPREEAELEGILRDFKSAVAIDVGFITEGIHGETPGKPVSVEISDPDGNVVYNTGVQEPVSEAQISTSSRGARGPWKVCFTTATPTSVFTIDLSYFHVNLPHLVGTDQAMSYSLNLEDAKLYTDAPTPEEMEAFATEEHVQAVKSEIKSMGTALYHLYYEQQFTRSKVAAQYNVMRRISRMSVFTGLLESAVIIGSSVFQVMCVRKLFQQRSDLKRPSGP